MCAEQAPIDGCVKNKAASTSQTVFNTPFTGINAPKADRNMRDLKAQKNRVNDSFSVCKIHLLRPSIANKYKR